MIGDRTLSHVSFGFSWASRFLLLYFLLFGVYVFGLYVFFFATHLPVFSCSCFCSLCLSLPFCFFFFLLWFLRCLFFGFLFCFLSFVVFSCLCFSFFLLVAFFSFFVPGLAKARKSPKGKGIFLCVFSSRLSSLLCFAFFLSSTFLFLLCFCFQKNKKDILGRHFWSANLFINYVQERAIFQKCSAISVLEFWQ